MLLYAIFVSMLTSLTGVSRPSNIEIVLKIRARGFIIVSTIQFEVECDSQVSSMLLGVAWSYR